VLREIVKSEKWKGIVMTTNVYNTFSTRKYGAGAAFGNNFVSCRTS
jgi:hypothetical protein